MSLFAGNCQIKSYKDSSATPAPQEFLRLWAAGGNDRKLGGGPYPEASVKFEIDNDRNNMINTVNTSTVNENGGKGNIGYHRTVIPIVTMHAIVDILAIPSPDQAWMQRNLLQHQGPTPYTFTPDQSSVAMLSIIGDSPSNHDEDN